MSSLGAVALVCLSLVVLTAHACYIQTCPFGPANFQKRSGTANLPQCGKCGPDGVGTCYGPNICCVAGQGCLLARNDHPWTNGCKKQAAKAMPCKPPGKTCSLNGPHDGFCAQVGICCNNDTCGETVECEQK